MKVKTRIPAMLLASALACGCSARLSQGGDQGPGGRTDSAAASEAGADSSAPVADSGGPKPDGSPPEVDGATKKDGQPPASTGCRDGAKNGGESDVDCGGLQCLRCATGKKCNTAADCAGPVCSAGVCAAGTDRWVSTSGNDSSSGTQAQPWRTIQHAGAAATAGTTVHVMPGTYAECIANYVSGNAQARIRFVSETKWGAKIACPNTSGWAWRIGGDYVDVVGFDVSGKGALGLWSQASYVRMMGNHVHDIPAAGCTSNGGAGIDAGNYSASDNEVIGNIVHDVGGDPLTVLCWRVHGIYMSNLRGRVANNIAYRNVGWGIHLWHAADEMTIVNNTVFANGYGGIIVGDGDSPGGVIVDDSLIANNIVFDNGIGPAPSGYGIEEYGSQVGANNRYINNLVFKNKPADWKLQGKTPVAPLSVDPMFQNYQSDGSGDYHLAPGSPCINDGISEAAPGYDLDGAARPVGSTYDLGAYESGGAPASYPFL